MQDICSSVTDTLAAMQAAVQAGELDDARLLGLAATIPLGLRCGTELQLGQCLSKGAESVVYRGSMDGQEVAIKKMRIGTSADLNRFRRELQMLAKLDHPNVVKLLGKTEDSHAHGSWVMLCFW